jgi:murein DD-endopeptidase MepM/ murein hydrolase activator NlpD
MSYYRILSITVLVFTLAGCVPLPVIKEPTATPPVTKKAGIYHKVAKGETLWRISKNYGVDIETLVESNGLSDAVHLKVGQQIFIPTNIVQPAPKLEPSPVYAREDFIWPVKGRIISSFGENRGSIPNKGIDIQARDGIIVAASRSGRVIFSEEKVKGFGKTIIIDHGDGIQTVYSHNSEILVKIGKDVRQSQPIAKVGSTGRGNSSYLHFEIRKRHKPQNPFYYLP